MKVKFYYTNGKEYTATGLMDWPLESNGRIIFETSTRETSTKGCVSTYSRINSRFSIDTEEVAGYTAKDGNESRTVVLKRKYFADSFIAKKSDNQEVSAAIECLLAIDLEAGGPLVTRGKNTPKPFAKDW